jgi:Na+/H+ antiporter NhaD/arsenite permease-like protein
MMTALKDLLSSTAVQCGLVAFSVLAVVASIVLVPRFLAKLPPNYLHQGEEPKHSLPLRIARNVLGAVLVALGVAMLVLPGQGLLTLLVGLLLVDFPGKHELVRRLMSKPKVLGVVNKLRSHHGAAPLTPA